MAGATGRVEGRRSTWWAVGYAVAVGGAVVTGVVGSTRPPDGGLTLLTVGLVLTAACLWWLDGRTVRSVTADAEGVLLESPRRRRAYRWDEVRRVRTRGARGEAQVDTALDLADGRLVALPAGTPGGTVERYRAGLGGGAAPAAGLPQSWEVTDEQVDWVALSFPMIVNMLLQPMVHLLDLSLLAAVGLGLIALVAWVPAAGLAVARRPRRQVVADATGVRFGRRGRRHVPWSDVAQVRPLSRFEPVTVLQRRDGGEVKVPGPPPEVVQEWHRLSGQG